jgi:transposase
MFVLAKSAEHVKARALRADGATYRRIAADLGVSINSAYRWTKDIELIADSVSEICGGLQDP